MYELVVLSMAVTLVASVITIVRLRSGFIPIAIAVLAYISVQLYAYLPRGALFLVGFVALNLAGHIVWKLGWKSEADFARPAAITALYIAALSKPAARTWGTPEAFFFLFVVPAGLVWGIIVLVLIVRRIFPLDELSSS